MENSRNPNQDRREFVASFLEQLTERVGPSTELQERARSLAGLGFGPLDALHVASAEEAGCTYLGTCDDRFMACARRNHQELQVQVVSLLELAALLPAGGDDEDRS